MMENPQQPSNRKKTSGRTEDPDPQERILAHMNADHAASLRLYLQACVPAPISYWRMANRTPAVTGISTEGMTIQLSRSLFYGEETRYMAFCPPLAALSEARARLVDLDHRARDQLGVSSINLQRWTPPGAIGWAVMVYVCLALLIFSIPTKLLRGDVGASQTLITPLRRALLCPWWPEGLFKVHAVLRPYMLGVILVVHSFEALVMIYTRLRPHGVLYGSGLWWQWVVGTWLEGIGSFWRFNTTIRQEQAKRGVDH